MSDLASNPDCRLSHAKSQFICFVLPADAGCNEISVKAGIDRCSQIVIGIEEAESSRVRCR